MPKQKNKRARGREQVKVKNQQVSAVPEHAQTVTLPDIPQLPETAYSSEGDIQQWRESLLDWMREQVQELEIVLLRYNTFDMLSNLIVTQLMTDPETYKEITHQGLPVIIEYVALLYLKHPYNEGEAVVIDGPVLEEVESRVRQILDAIKLYYASEAFLRVHDNKRNFDDFRFLTITDELFVRSPGYAHHQRGRLLALFSSIKEWLLQNLGFSVDDVLAIDQAIDDMTMRKLADRRREEQQAMKQIHAELHDYRLGKIYESENEELFQRLAHLPLNEARKQIRLSMMGWFFSFLGRTVFAFTSEEVAKEANIPVERVQAALNYFSLEFGSMPSDFYMLSPTHELKRQPFMRVEDAYMYPVPGSLIWAVQPRLEELLNPGSKVKLNTNQRLWEKYKDDRGEYLERETLSLFGQALQHAQIYHSLSYNITEDGVQKTPELDGLIIYDTTLFLVEMKAGTLTLPARRGSKERMKRDLKDLMGEAHRQAQRARRYIESTDAAEFMTKDRQKVVVHKDAFRRIFLVTVTLEPLDVFHATLHDLAGTGLFEEGKLPWAVSLDVLRVICETNEFPTQLVHYLLRRLQLNERGNIYAHDELDLYGVYLTKGLYFQGSDIEEANFIHILSHTTPFDDYYFYEMGIRETPATKPRQPIPQLLRDIILELEQHHDVAGHSDAVLQLLDWDDRTRKQFVRFYERIRRLTRRDGGIHDFTLVSTEAKAGLTCFSALTRDADDAYRRLATYAQMKKYQTRADQWLGMLTLTDHKGLLHGFVTSLAPWTPNEELDALVSALPAPGEDDVEK